MGYGRERPAVRHEDSSGTTYRGRPLANPHEEVFDQGLAFDLETLLDRRRVLKLIGIAGLGAIGAFTLTGCGSSPTASDMTIASAAATGQSGGGETVADCSLIPEETGGPYPADGSNGPNVLTQSGIVRNDIRTSFGDFSGTAEGVPLTIRLAILDASNGCSALPGAAVYVWHCDRDGMYSLYSVSDQNYLRGVAETGDDGVVEFTSIFPACYSGRWPHVHFDVYQSLADATDQANAAANSQIALPEDVCNEVYTIDGYNQSVSNLQQTSLEHDNVFGDDGGARELGSVSGAVADGLTIELAVPVTP